MSVNEEIVLVEKLYAEGECVITDELFQIFDEECVAIVCDDEGQYKWVL